VARGFFPLDEQLGLVAGQFAPRLIEGIVRLGTWMPFGQVPEMLAFFTGGSIDADTARRLTERAGAALVAVTDAAVLRLERTPPPAPPGPPVQQLSADGAMVPLVGGVWAEVKTLAIGTVERDAAGTIHTTQLSYCSRLTDAQQFARVTRGETQRRGTETAGVVCAVQDGAPWIQELVAVHRPDAVRILDFPHAVQQVSAVGQAVWGRGVCRRRHGWIGSATRSNTVIPTSCWRRCAPFRCMRRPYPHRQQRRAMQYWATWRADGHRSPMRSFRRRAIRLAVGSWRVRTNWLSKRV
jgi:hypothetical protein